MNANLDIIKGIHPGIILERELLKRKLKKSQFALSLREYPQTIVSITKAKRDMNTPLSLKIEKALNIEEGYFMTLQVFYEIEKEKRKKLQKPDISKLRTVLFWDTNIESIDWLKNKKAVLQRVSERGNEIEKNEIEKFYSLNLSK